MKNTKKVFAGILSLSFLLSAVPVGVSAAELSPQINQNITSEHQLKLSTPEEYIAFLKAKNPVQNNSFSIASTGSIEENTDLAEFISQYTSLPYEEQQKIVDYFNDPQFLITLVNAQTIEGEGSKSYYDGDLVVTSRIVPVSKNTSDSISLFAVGDTKEHGYIYEAITEVLGMKFIQTNLELTIRTKEVKTNASQIDAILTKRAILVKNFSPADIEKTQYPVTINSAKTTAKLETDWSWHFLWSGLGLTVGTKRQWLQIDKAGTPTYDIYNL